MALDVRRGESVMSKTIMGSALLALCLGSGCGSDDGVGGPTDSDEPESAMGAAADESESMMA